MQNRKIIIFGDSFADPSPNHGTSTTAWYEYLEKDFDFEITNHAKSGTGPHYSFKEYYNFISDNEIRKEDYILIFLLSGEYRIDFPDVGSHSFDNEESHWVERPSLKHQNKAYYDFFKREIDFMFLTMHDELKWSNFKNLGFLYMNSLLLDMKTLVFHCLNPKIDSFGKQLLKLNFSKLNNPNFYLYSTELETISHEEFIDFEEGDIDDRLIRRNHFSQENHTILYKNVKKMINNDYNLIPFVKNICRIKK